MTEREVQSWRSPAASWIFRCPSAMALDVEALLELTLRATYFDTLDLRLARHGVTPATAPASRPA